MESKNYSINELALDPKEAIKIMTKLIDAQINTYRLQSIQDWEKNHSNGAKWENQIKKLQEFKQHLQNDLESFSKSSELLRLNFSLGLDPVTKHEILKVG